MTPIILSNAPDSHSAAVIAAVSGILVALITGSSVIIAKWVETRKQLLKTQSEKNSLLLQLQEEQNVLGGFGTFLYSFAQVEQVFDNLCESTNISRIILFCALNGDVNPKHTTAVWVFRRAKGNHHVHYVRVSLDHDYQERLVQCRQGPLRVVTAQTPPNSLIGELYRAEEVTEAMWLYLHRKEMPDSGRVLHTYMSFATMHKAGISHDEAVQCRIAADQLRPLIT